MNEKKLFASSLLCCSVLTLDLLSTIIQGVNFLSCCATFHGTSYVKIKTKFAPSLLFRQTAKTKTADNFFNKSCFVYRKYRRDN